MDKYVSTVSIGTRSWYGGRKYDVIVLLMNVAKAAVKEKVTRVVIATLRVRSFRKPWNDG